MTALLGTLAPTMGANHEPTLHAVLFAYATRKGAGPDEANLYAQQYLTIIEGELRKHDPLTQYGQWVEDLWGEVGPPEELLAELTKHGETLTSREQLILNHLSQLRSDYIMVAGLAGETGEVIEVLKKGMRPGRTLDRPHLKEELGDAFYNWMRLVKRHGFDPYEIMTENREKLEYRKAEAALMAAQPA